MYLPNQFIPINSKNTLFSYESFPALLLPITADKNILDIWRGYIMERFIWLFNGSVLYIEPETYIEYKKYEDEKENFDNFRK